MTLDVAKRCLGQHRRGHRAAVELHLTVKVVVGQLLQLRSDLATACTEQLDDLVGRRDYTKGSMLRVGRMDIAARCRLTGADRARPTGHEVVTETDMSRRDTDRPTFHR